jgi:hypothetical protein
MAMPKKLSTEERLEAIRIACSLNAKLKQGTSAADFITDVLKWVSKGGAIGDPSTRLACLALTLEFGDIHRRKRLEGENGLFADADRFLQIASGEPPKGGSGARPKAGPTVARNATEGVRTGTSG